MLPVPIVIALLVAWSVIAFFVGWERGFKDGMARVAGKAYWFACPAKFCKRHRVADSLLCGHHSYKFNTGKPVECDGYTMRRGAGL